MKFTQYKYSLLLYIACQPVYAHSGKLGLLGESALVAIILFIAIKKFRNSVSLMIV